MRSLSCVSIAVFALSAAVAAAATTKPFVDPAPPRANARRDVPAPAAGENPDVTFRAAPKPLAKRAVTSDWPSFLGPTHNMVSTETALLKNFPPEGPRVVWEMKKGDGFAGPAIQGDRLILFHRVGGEERVECLHPLDGKRYWQHRYPSAYKDRYGFNPGPRASPVVADGRVFTFGAEGKLHCLDLQTGQVLWQRDILGEFNLKQNFFGVGATPLVEGGQVIINVGAPGGPCVAAFDVATGKMTWGAGGEWGPSYASPIPATMHGKRRVFVFAGGESRPATGGLLCVDPATGNVDFTFPWRGDRYESVNAASPVIIGHRVFVAECYGAGGALVEVLPDGGVKPVWKNPTFGMHFMSAVVKGDHLYGVDGHGPQDAELVCVELATGREVWRHQPIWEEPAAANTGGRAMKLGTFRASLLMIDGKTLCLGEFGHLLWLDLAPDGYHEMARAWLFAGTETWTPPVVSRGLLYVSQNSRGMFHNEPQRLFCYDLRAPE
ncbi:MAG TPA: PQQ-binding-like beta-propeller repeat protein [Opitutaceae bacterium]|nr:PQQ-binding-like beta-propeller repeat protein [Opitutaceae bacterium]